MSIILTVLNKLLAAAVYGGGGEGAPVSITNQVYPMTAAVIAM